MRLAPSQADKPNSYFSMGSVYFLIFILKVLDPLFIYFLQNLLLGKILISDFFQSVLCSNKKGSDTFQESGVQITTVK